jgi:hypothetical protein
VSNLKLQAGLPDTGEQIDTKALLDGAEEARNILGERFGDALKSALGFSGPFSPRPSVTHYLLASLPMHNVVTTNFDPLLELSFKFLKKSLFYHFLSQRCGSCAYGYPSYECIENPRGFIHT